MKPLKITQIGNSLGVILPREVLAELKAEKGDTLSLTRGPGGYKIAAVNDPAFDRQMGMAREVMRKRRDALRALAK
jgi:putative addiction module antidote